MAPHFGATKKGNGHIIHNLQKAVRSISGSLFFVFYFVRPPAFAVYEMMSSNFWHKAGQGRIRRSTAAIVAILALSACDPGSDEQGVGGLSPDDAKALDEAAAKLDAENALVPAAAAPVDVTRNPPAPAVSSEQPQPPKPGPQSDRSPQNADAR